MFMMAESHPQQIKKKVESTASTNPQPLTQSRVDFIISTYPDLQPFLEMVVVLLEGVYEHVKTLNQAAPTEKSK